MAVYIPKFDVPKDCDECWTKYHGFGLVDHDEEWGTFYCKIANGFCSDNRTTCPLIEVSERHGPLIDADDLCARFDEGIHTISMLPFPKDFTDLYARFADDVKSEVAKCHTVIPSRKDGEK